MNFPSRDIPFPPHPWQRVALSHEATLTTPTEGPLQERVPGRPPEATPWRTRCTIPYKEQVSLRFAWQPHPTGKLASGSQTQNEL